MSGFSVHWLGLREPVDHASRNVQVRTALLDYLKQQRGRQLSGLRIIDLGCGSGSNLRALAPFLGRNQHWTLVDYDPLLLRAARDALMQWADVVVQDQPEVLVIRKGSIELSIKFCQADLNKDWPSLIPEEGCDLVTAAALFDLVSVDWIERFCSTLRVPFYTVLTYDGQARWLPEHPLDEAIVAAFHVHQHSDKGFGPAAGPDASESLAQALVRADFKVVRGSSPWDLDGQQASLMNLLHQGIAQAAIETQAVKTPDVNDWLAARRSSQSCYIGHEDVFALPPLAR